MKLALLYNASQSWTTQGTIGHARVFITKLVRRIINIHWPDRITSKELGCREKQEAPLPRRAQRIRCAQYGELYDISREKICWLLINHFYVIGHESYRIRRYYAK